MILTWKVYSVSISVEQQCEGYKYDFGEGKNQKCCESIDYGCFGVPSPPETSKLSVKWLP